MPTAGAGWRIETGWRVKATESMADRAAPVVGTSALFALGWLRKEVRSENMYVSKVNTVASRSLQELELSGKIRSLVVHGQVMIDRKA